MASAFSHAFVGLALGKAYTRHRMPWHFWALSITCSIVPDADVLGFALGIPYASPLGHRGLSHSLCFAFVLSLCVVSLAFRQHVPYSRLWCSHVLYFFVVTASHGVLDAMTDGGKGLPFWRHSTPRVTSFPGSLYRFLRSALARFLAPAVCASLGQS